MIHLNEFFSILNISLFKIKSLYELKYTEGLLLGIEILNSLLVVNEFGGEAEDSLERLGARNNRLSIEEGLEFSFKSFCGIKYLIQ